MGRVGWRRLLPVLAAGIALTFVLAGASLADHNPDYEGRADSHVVISGDPGCPTTDSRSVKVEGAPAETTYNDRVAVSNLVTNGAGQVVGFDWTLTRSDFTTSTWLP